MNKGVIAGQVLRDGRGVRQATIGLDGPVIRTGTGMMRVYDVNSDSATDRLRAVSRGTGFDMPPPLQNLFTSTDSGGYFSLSFAWSGTELGGAIDNPRFQIYVSEDIVGTNVITNRVRGRYQGRMATRVDMRQVANGLIPDPTQFTDLLQMGVDIHAIARHIRLPRMGFTIASPSADWFGMLGMISIRLT